MDELILVRHGETIHNLAGIAQGWNDSALSERGEQQVANVGRRLAAYEMTAIYSSPLARALATAAKISESTGLPVITVEDLREMHCGEWEGQPFLAVRQHDPEVFRRWVEDPDYPCPGGESHTQVRRRMDNALRSIADAERKRSEAVRAIIVSHGTAIRLVATALLAVPVVAARGLAQDNAAINHFIWRSDRWVLKAWNDTTHCP